MATGTEQLHAREYAARRAVSALTSGDPVPATSPVGRYGRAALAGVLVTALAVAAAAGYGRFVAGAAPDWRDGRSVVVEAESGERFVYLDGTLHPALNLASARLAIGPGARGVLTVPRAELAGTPRGAGVGISDAPDALPARGSLSNGAWSVCSTPAGAAVRSVVSLAAPREPGQALGDDALLVSAAGATSLIWHQHRYLVKDTRFVLDALGLGDHRQLLVAPELVNAVPPGADIGRIQVADPGRYSSARPGARIGQVYVTRPDGAPARYAVAREDKLVGVTALEAALLVAEAEAGYGDAGSGDEDGLDYEAGDRGPRGAESLTPQEFAEAGVQAPAVTAESVPAEVPKLATASTGVACAVVPGDGGVAEVRIDGVLADSGRRVVVPAGGGALVRASAGPGTSDGPVFLVTEAGRRFRVAGPAAQAALGYTGVTPIALPASTVALVPSGPALDPAAVPVPR